MFWSKYGTFAEGYKECLSLCSVGRTSEAWVNYNTALQLNPNHTVALVNMGRQLSAAGKIQDAERAYKRFALRYIILCEEFPVYYSYFSLKRPHCQL